MWLRLPLVTLIALSFLFVSPLESWSQKLEDHHDCFKIRKGRYKCVRGPLAGQTFKSDLAMVRALTQGFGPLETKKHKMAKTKKKVKKVQKIKKGKKRFKKKKAKSRKHRRRSRR